MRPFLQGVAHLKTLFGFICGIGMWLGTALIYLDFFFKTDGGIKALPGWTSDRAFVWLACFLIALMLLNQLESRHRFVDKIIVLLTTASLIPFTIIVFAIRYYVGDVCGASGCTLGKTENSFYFSVVTFTTLGYGDFAPGVESRMDAAIEALLGTIIILVLAVQLGRSVSK